MHTCMHENSIGDRQDCGSKPWFLVHNSCITAHASHAYTNGNNTKTCPHIELPLHALPEHKGCHALDVLMRIVIRHGDVQAPRNQVVSFESVRAAQRRRISSGKQELQAPYITCTPTSVLNSVSQHISSEYYQAKFSCLSSLPAGRRVLERQTVVGNVGPAFLCSLEQAKQVSRLLALHVFQITDTKRLTAHNLTRDVC
jgi:hypothetical protein